MIRPAEGSAILLIAFFVTSILNYFFNVALGWLLLPEQYGIYGVSIAFLGILTLFVISGFPWATAKFLSEESKGKDEQYRIFKSSLGGNMTIAVVISLAFYWIASSQIISLEDVYKPLIQVVLLTVFILSIRFVFFGALQGFFKFKAMGFIQILETLLKLVVGISLVYLGLGVFGALMGFLTPLLLSTAIMFFLLRDFKFWKVEGWADLGVYAFAAPMFLGMLATTLIMNFDILGVKFLTTEVSDTLAGYYLAAIILARVPYFIASAMMTAIFPFISRHAENGARGYSAMSLKYTALFVLPISLAIALIPEAFITLIFPEVYVAGAKALGIVAIGMGFLALIQVLANIFQALGKPRVPAIVLTLAVSLQFVILLLLVPKYGIVGAAASTTIACFIGLSVLAVVYARMNTMAISFREILATLLSIGLLSVLVITLPHSTRMLTIADLTLASIFYFIALALLKLIRERDLDILLGVLPEGRASRRIREAAIAIVAMLNKVF